MGDELFTQESGYNSGEVAHIKRIRKYGTKGIVKVRSSEGASVPLDAAKNLVPSTHE